MRIDRKKLKLKWALDLYQELEGFPTREDCLYLLVKTLEENEMLDKEFNIHNVWGGMKSLHHKAYYKYFILKNNKSQFSIYL